MQAVSQTADSVTLFGDEKNPWQAKDWTDSDDRVRGGASQSYLDCSKDRARFYGTLDIDTLGGAGFASQHTTGEDRSWDLKGYAGIQLNILKGDKKRYTFILKDEILPPNKENGREQASISYECDFELPPQAEPGESHDRSIFIPFKSLNPTYRGRIKKDADPLNTKDIKRISIMNRSFFGTQKGDFSLTIESIKALKEVPKKSASGNIVEDSARLESGDVEEFDRKKAEIKTNILKGLAYGAFAILCMEAVLERHKLPHIILAMAIVGGLFHLVWRSRWFDRYIDSVVLKGLQASA